MAVRYINQIDIPFPADGYLDYKDYFRTAPEVAAELTQTLSGFFMQLHFPQPDFGGMLTLTQNAGAPSSDGVQRVIFDLDVFKDGMIINGEEWDLLETLRNRKNEFFEGSVTDKARALFGKGEEY